MSEFGGLDILTRTTKEEHGGKQTEQGGVGEHENMNVYTSDAEEDASLVPILPSGVVVGKSCDGASNSNPYVRRGAIQCSRR